MATGLDPTFGFGGSTLLSFPTSPIDSADVSISRLAIQPDGKIVGVGQISQSTSTTSTDDIVVVRLNPDGTLDTGFGNGGRTTVPFTIGGVAGSSSANGLAIGPNGAIFVGGTVNVPSGGGSITNFSDFGVAALSPTGAVVRTNTIDVGSSDSLSGLALSPDNTLVLAGSVFKSSTGPISTGSDFGVVKVSLTDLLPVAGFGTNGVTTIDFGSTAAVGMTPGITTNDSPSGVAVDSTGRIIVGGTTSTTTFTSMTPTTTSSFAVARLTSNGALDAGFDGDGKQTITFNNTPNVDRASSVGVLSDDRVLLVGTTRAQASVENPTTGDLIQPQIDNIAMALLTTAGALDPSFGLGGRRLLPINFGGGSSSSSGRQLVVAPNDQFYISGSVSNSATGAGVLAKLNTNGSLDPAFGTNGIALLAGSSPNALALQSDGKLVFSEFSSVSRTTAPTPVVDEITPIVTGKKANAKTKTLTVKFNTRLNKALLTKKGVFMVRLGKKGKNFIDVKKVTVDEAGQTATLQLKQAVKVKSITAKKPLQVIIASTGAVGADGQVLNGGQDSTTDVTLPTT